MKRTSLLVTFLVSSTALADIIYKTVDEQGNVRYSDKAPESEILMQTIEMETAVEGNHDAQARSQRMIEQMAATSDRLQDAREDRSESRRKDRELDILANQQPDPPLIYREPVYTPAFGHGYYGDGLYPRADRFREPVIDLRLGAKKDNARFDLRYSSGSRHAEQPRQKISPPALLAPTNPRDREPGR